MNAWAEACFGLGVAVLLLLDLLTTRGLATWGAHTLLEAGAACIALGFSGRPWLRRSRVAARPAEPSYGAPHLLVGPPHIDLRLWAEVTAAMRAECASARIRPFDPAPFANPSGEAHRNQWEPAPRYALVLEQPPGRIERSERRSYRRHASRGERPHASSARLAVRRQPV